MVAHILLEGLVAQHETESPTRIHVDGLLQVQFVEGNHLLCGSCPLLLADHEMKLAVDEPVVGHVENCPIVEKELREFPWFGAVDVHGFGCRWEIVRGIPRQDGHSIVQKCRRPELVTGCPPAEIGWPERAGDERENINLDDRRGRTDGTKRRPKRDRAERAHGR